MVDAALPAATVASPELRVRPQLGRDDWIMRAFLAVIAVYLTVALALPLATMVSKSFEVRTFPYDSIHIARLAEDGSEEVRTLGDWAADAGFAEAVAQAGRSSAIPAVRLFPGWDSPDSTVVAYRVLNRSGEAGTAEFDRKQLPLDEWVEIPRDQIRSVVFRAGTARSVANYVRYVTTPALFNSVGNSLLVAILTTAFTVTLAFGFAYALTRTQMPFKGAFKTIGLVPILVPSLLPGIGLVYLFGNQGLLRDMLMGQSIYGPIGIVMASVFFTFPHALIIITVALSISDARLYEAATVLRAPAHRVFWTVTLPGARYGLISAAFVVFTLTITDFGVPKVIGGQYNVLAVDIYKQVVGQQNFEMGAVVSIVLLIPAVLAFVVDRFATRRQVALLSSRAVPYMPKPNARLDWTMFGYCAVVSALILGILATCQFAALVTFWPYNLELTLRHYNFDLADGGGWKSYRNSLTLALWTAFVGTGVIFLCAYVVERVRAFDSGRAAVQFLAMMPMAIPGMVLGLSYIFFFNSPANPLNVIYGTMAILVISTITHFYTVAHLTAVTALKQMDPEFESVSASLKQPVTRVFARVTIPVCTPAILDIWIYLFVNAMTTVSAVVFLYSPLTTLASVAVLNMDDAGQLPAAAAMGMMIFYTNLVMRVVHLGVGRLVQRRTQAWRIGS
ncbi:iron(III) transport system permease protein [Tepidamorphus gemmatus]|uniref:Iron(III) transport system permease protein n=2 Tax=Tepidamorphus gemmatus TaxID=747076 RepID=A0A4R3M099_9HYPH|nr:iron(III) transport system permease protein [Tepidamorphus gemmatus]